MPRVSATDLQAAQQDQHSEAFGSSIQPQGVTEDRSHDTAGDDRVGEATTEPAPKPETPLETIQRAITQLEQTRTWALAKADAMEERIAAVGGEPSAAVKEAIAKLRGLAGA